MKAVRAQKATQFQALGNMFPIEANPPTDWAPALVNTRRNCFM